MSESSPARLEQPSSSPGRVESSRPPLPGPETNRAAASPWINDLEAQYAQRTDSPDKLPDAPSRSGIIDWASKIARIFVTPRVAPSSSQEASGVSQNVTPPDAVGSSENVEHNIAPSEPVVSIVNQQGEVTTTTDKVVEKTSSSETETSVTTTQSADKALQYLREKLLIQNVSSVMSLIGATAAGGGALGTLVIADWKNAAFFSLATAGLGISTKFFVHKADESVDKIKVAMDKIPSTSK